MVHVQDQILKAQDSEVYNGDMCAAVILNTEIIKTDISVQYNTILPCHELRMV